LNKGKRYEEPKLNIKKVFAVIIAIAVIIMFVFILKNIITKESEQTRIVSKDYFSIYKDNKWGVIDSNGEIVINPSYEEMIIIPNSKNDVFLCIYDVNYETGEYKTKALNSKNEEIYTQFEQIEAIQNRDLNNNLWYESNVLKVKKDGKYGVINLSGKELTEHKYDMISAVEGISNILKVEEEGKIGIIDNEGKEILESKYLDISVIGQDSKSGFIVTDENGKYGLIDYSGNRILENKYDGIEKIYGNDLYVVKQAGKQVLIQKDGEEVLKEGFDQIKEILKNKEHGIIFMRNSKFGVMKTTGEIVIEPIYEDLREAKVGIFIANKEGKYGIIDIEKDIKVDFIYTTIGYYERADIYVSEDTSFNNHILDNTFEVKLSGILIDLDEDRGYIEIRQGEETKYYNFKFEERKVSDIFTINTLYVSKKDGKYGFVDKDSNVVVDYIYDDAVKQNIYGYSAIKKDGKWGSIDARGNIVQEPIYDLEEYLKIDFIGRWHYGKDINMNYYNQL